MSPESNYTVRQLARAAGVSARTLHYYDEIGLLSPSRNPHNGYRLYDRPAMLRLQQILFLRELGLSLEEIQLVIDRPDFDLLSTLEGHRLALLARKERLAQLVNTVERTILHLRGKIDMESKELFEGFSEEKQKEYEDEIRRRYGDSEQLRESRKRWGGYSADEKRRIMEEGKTVYLDMVAAMPSGPTSAQAQAIVARWEQHLRYFYEPNTEILLGLADMYNDEPEFASFFQRIHPELNSFMRQAIQFYCKDL
jgi:DNA-binding transcriptional MerR regulator